jgi:hypothetical protein
MKKINYGLNFLKLRKLAMSQNLPVVLPQDNNNREEIKRYLFNKSLKESIDKKVCIFCTTCLAVQPGRLQKWTDYYKEYFKGHNFDYYAFNDGPEFINIEGVNYFPHNPWLGRPGHNIMPGWKRSFHSALVNLKDKYERIVHIESDMKLEESIKTLFLNAIDDDNYYCGWDRTHGNTETALQIFSKRAIDFFVNRYNDKANWNEDFQFEEMVRNELRPYFAFAGIRLEGTPIRNSVDYLAQYHF